MTCVCVWVRGGGGHLQHGGGDSGSVVTWGCLVGPVSQRGQLQAKADMGGREDGLVARYLNIRQIILRPKKLWRMKRSGLVDFLAYKNAKASAHNEQENDDPTNYQEQCYRGSHPRRRTLACSRGCKRMTPTLSWSNLDNFSPGFARKSQLPGLPGAPQRRSTPGSRPGQQPPHPPLPFLPASCPTSAL